MSGSKPRSTVSTEPSSDRGASLDLLYRRHFAWLVRVARMRFGADLAEDLVQETYLRAASYQGGETIRHPRALLLKIATRVAIDQARHRRLGARDYLIEDRQVQSEADQAETVLLKQVVLTLPPHLRDVFVLSRFAGMSYEEIAQHRRIAVKTVEWRMSKALAICAAVLRE